MTPAVVDVSVIIPARNAQETLRRALEALAASLVRPREVIVVDDQSTDGTAEVAREFGVRLLSMSRQGGPARARNIAGRVAVSEILFFLDADVCVYPDTLERAAAAFSDTSTGALIGSYDDDPLAPDFISQYKNLMHCFVHQSGFSEASTFWSGCGAIRRTIFLGYSGFDESYARPAIEDIELGYRLKTGGHRILLDPGLQVKHLKRWTFWSLLKTDIMDRGIPWTELILRDQRMPNDLNLQLSQRVSVALVYLMLGIATACAVYWRGYFLAPLFALLFFLLGRYWLDGARRRTRTVTAVMVAAAGAIVFLAWQQHIRGLIPLLLLSFPALFLRHRYAPEKQAANFWMNALWPCYLVFTAAALLFYFPERPLTGGLAATLLAILILNREFYVFLAAKRGRWFALAAVPFHLLYHFYNGLSFAIGLMRWAWRSVTSPKPSVETAPGRR